MTKSAQPVRSQTQRPGFRIVAEPRKEPDVQLFADALIAHVLDEMEREKNGGKLKGKSRASQVPFTLPPMPKRKAD